MDGQNIYKNLTKLELNSDYYSHNHIYTSKYIFIFATLFWSYAPFRLNDFNSFIFSNWSNHQHASSYDLIEHYMVLFLNYIFTALSFMYFWTKPIIYYLLLQSALQILIFLWFTPTRKSPLKPNA